MDYTVTLHDAPKDLPEALRQSTEYRFRRSLERSLRSSDSVIEAYKAWRQVEETDVQELNEHDISLAKQWQQAATRAYQEAFRELGECEAYFEIRVQN